MRHVLLLTSLLFAQTAVAVAVAEETTQGPASAETASLPNIVVILADDLGWHDLGYQGSEIRTPNIDALATSGVRLNRFYAQPMCSPTRAALLTGKSSVRLGITRALSKLNPTGLPIEERILPQYLKDLGYQTSLVGKWHLGFRQREYLPTSRGFDTFYGHLTGGIGYWDHVHGGGYDWQWMDVAGKGEVRRDEGYSTHLIAEEAVRQIEAHRSDAPLFLYASFNAPHLPNEAPDETIASYAEIEDPRRRLHAAMVTELDDGIGEIINALEEEGMLDKTLIWFMSDNGGLNSSAFPESAVSTFSYLDSWFGDYQLPITFLEFFRVNVLEGGSDNGSLRSGKGTVYEGGVRVPSFLYWRGQLDARQVDAMVTVQDVVPSLLAMLGRDGGDVEFDGAAKWAMLRDGVETQAPHYLVAATGGEALFQYPWKLVSLSSGDIELYNVVDDPSEEANLADVSDHAQRRDDMLNVFNSQPRGEPVNIELYKALWNMDFFGGEEEGPPWFDIIQ